MREGLKGVCLLAIVVGAIAGALVWFDDRPNSTTWVLRVVLPTCSIIGLAGFLRIHWARDVLPDYLRQECGAYFECNGLCFAFKPARLGRGLIVQAFFQNRHAKPCRAKLALVPCHSPASADIASALHFEIDCPEGGFGVARVALPVKREQLGKVVRFKIGAEVIYPNGKGAMLRFRDGEIVRHSTSLQSAFGSVAFVLGLLGGALVWTSPAKWWFEVPFDVVESERAPVGEAVCILATFRPTAGDLYEDS